MARLLLAGAVLVALAIGFFVWGGDDDEQKPGPADQASDSARAADDRRGSAARNPEAPPRRVAPPPAARRTAPAVPPAALESSGQLAPPPTTTDREPPPELPREDLDPKTAEIRAAQELFDAKDYEAAAAAGVALIEKYPGTIDAYRVAVPALCAMGEAEEANRLARQVRNRDARRSIVKHCRRLGLEIP